MEDYYAILGLDAGASAESIKLAYRRLAREKHPDLNIDSTGTEKDQLSLDMALLNGAYAILSDTAKRREYDEKMRILGSLKDSGSSRAGKTSPATAAKPNSNHRVQPATDADSTIAQDFSRTLRSNLLNNRKGFTWKEASLEGFDWGLESVSWATHYCVAGRAFPVLDPAAAKKFANYSEVVISRFNRPVRKSHFLFLLPFLHLSQWDTVSSQLNRLFSKENRETKVEPPIGILLFDVRRGRTLRIGARLEEKHFEDLLLCLGPELMKSK